MRRRTIVEGLMLRRTIIVERLRQRQRCDTIEVRHFLSNKRTIIYLFKKVFELRMRRKF